jgi:protocatechuate 3,4-dioxygenase, beta subunit
MTPNRARRRLLAASAVALCGMAPELRLAAALVRTPRQSAGPFYPLEIPLDHDNDLITVRGRPGSARGDISNVAGRVLTADGRPVAGARVEIWQCDANGRYRHPREWSDSPIDPNFQGYGMFTTAADGAYRFRTIKPVPYPGRAPHIHFRIEAPGTTPLVTQMYVRGAPENASDLLLNRIRDAAARESVIVEFTPDPRAPGEMRAAFDIVLNGDPA